MKFIQSYEQYESINEIRQGILPPTRSSTRNVRIPRSDLYHSIDANEYFEKSKFIVGINYREFSELSEFFNKNFPDIYYSRGIKMNKGLDDNGYGPSGRNLNSALTFLEIRSSAVNFKKIQSLNLNEENCFTFTLIKKIVYGTPGDRRIYSSNSLILITKIEDNYFLVYDITYDPSGFLSKTFSRINSLFICDDIDGLISFLADQLSYLKNYKYDTSTFPHGYSSITWSR